MYILKHHSDRKFAELNESKTCLLCAEEASILILCKTDTKGNFIYTSPAFCDLTGYSQKELLLMNYEDITHPDDIKESLKNIQHITNSKISNYTMVKRYVNKNGTTILSNTHVSLVRDNFSREPHLIILIYDITRLNTVEQRLKETEALLRNMTNNTMEIISLIDNKGIIKFITPSVQDILGYKPEDLIGKNSTELVHPADVFHLSQIIYFETKNCNLHKVEYRCKHLEGHYVWLEVSGKVLVDDEGNFSEAIFCAHDISKRKTIEEELKASDEKFMGLYNNLTDAIFLHEFIGISIPGRFIEVNEVACQVYGYTREEFLTMTPADLDEERDLHGHPSILGKFFRNKFIIVNRTLVTKQGNVIPVEIRSHTFSVRGKKVVLSIVRDVSELKKADQALRESEQLLRKLLENVPVGVLAIDSDFKVKLWNSTLEKMSGIHRNDIFNCNLFEKFTLLSGVGLEKIFEGVIENNQHLAPYTFSVNSSDSKKEFSFVNIRANPIKYFFGKGTGLIATIEDITQQKLAEKALSDSEERYRTLIEFFPDGIAVHEYGTVVFANNAFVKLMAANSIDDIIGRSAESFIHPDYREIVMAKIKKEYERNDICTLIEEKFIKLNGEPIDVEVGATAIPYMDKPAIMAIIRDITERRKAEELWHAMEENTTLLNQALEMDQLKTEFFANVSHELRTPLNVILTTIQTLNLFASVNLSGEDSKKIARYIKIMQQNCFRLLRLINNLIDITKIDSGFFELHLQNCNIISVVEEITMSVADYVENKGLQLLFDTEIEEKIIACDPDKIERIILNLLSNAVKFTKPGGQISVTITERESTIAISVKDTGIGIPSDKLNIIFERFRQVNKTLTRDHEGSGIGLSLVKSLVEMHEGKIELFSEYGRGSEFIIELPVKLLATQDCLSDISYTPDSVIQRINIEFSDIYT